MKAKKDKKWFKGGGPFFEINKLTTDLRMISATKELMIDALPFDTDLYNFNKIPWWDEEVNE